MAPIAAVGHAWPRGAAAQFFLTKLLKNEVPVRDVAASGGLRRRRCWNRRNIGNTRRIVFGSRKRCLPPTSRHCWKLPLPGKSAHRKPNAARCSKVERKYQSPITHSFSSRFLSFSVKALHFARTGFLFATDQEAVAKPFPVALSVETMSTEGARGPGQFRHLVRAAPERRQPACSG